MSDFTQFIEQFHFLRPWFLLALLPALVLAGLMLFMSAQGSLWKRAIDPALLPFLLDSRKSGRDRLPGYGLLLIWVLGSLALAGPVWQQLPVPVQEREDAMVIVLDLSLSMHAQDLSPDRITRARRKLADVLSRRSDEGQTALVVYAGDAHTVTPLTSDVDTIRNMLPALLPDIMPEPGSIPVRGLEVALSVLTNAGVDQARILLMTDGIDEGDVAPLSALLKSSRHRLSILGVGTEQGAPIPTSQGGFLRDEQNAIVVPRLNRERLQRLAADTGGRYTDIQLDDGDIDYLLAQSVFEENEQLIASEREFDTWYEAGPWLLLLALPLAALAFRRGWLMSIVLMIFLAPSAPVQAQNWQALWKNKDQRAQEAFAEEDFEQASETFKDQRWRAASHYRQGNMEAVVSELEGHDDATSHYNRGNALARLFRLEEAIAAYDAALALEPEFEDARANRALVEDMLKDQEGEQPDTGEQSGDEEPQDQDSQEQQGEPQEDGSEQDQQEQSDSEDQQGEGDQQPEDSEQEGEQDQPEGEQGQDQEQSEQEQRMDAQNVQPDSEEEQSMQQWLGRIKDDPAELLRNKFRQQSQQRLFEQLRGSQRPAESENRKIW